MPLNEEGFISRVSIRHSVSADAVRTILRALRSGGGTMAQFSHWSELPREVQEKLFETAVPLDPVTRNRLAIFLHDRHPRTAHPPKPTQLA